jgi:hypothetical protein
VTFVQFVTRRTLSGEVEVIDAATGHAVGIRPTARSAQHFAFELNRAADAGGAAAMLAAATLGTQGAGASSERGAARGRFEEP